MSCPPPAPPVLQTVNTGTCCDSQVNTVVNTMNEFNARQYQYAQQYCQYQADVSHWSQRTGSFADPIDGMGGNFQLNGANTGVPDICQGGNPEDDPTNQQYCKTAAKNLGSPYYNDYTTIPGQSLNCYTRACCFDKRWTPQCSRQSNDQWNAMKPIPPSGPPEIPNISWSCSCCQQNVDLSNIKAGGNVNVGAITSACSIGTPSAPAPAQTSVPSPSSVPSSSSAPANTGLSLSTMSTQKKELLGGGIAAALCICCFIVLFVVMSDDKE